MTHNTGNAILSHGLRSLGVDCTYSTIPKTIKNKAKSFCWRGSASCRNSHSQLKFPRGQISSSLHAAKKSPVPMKRTGGSHFSQARALSFLLQLTLNPTPLKNT